MTMVERVALVVENGPWGLIGKADARLIARAAIEAMRKPTEEMERALNSYAVCAGYVPEGWGAAIDAALAEALDANHP